MNFENHSPSVIWAIIGTTYVLAIMAGVVIGYIIAEFHNQKLRKQNNRSDNNE